MVKKKNHDDQSLEIFYLHDICMRSIRIEIITKIQVQWTEAFLFNSKTDDWFVIWKQNFSFDTSVIVVN